MNSNIWFLSFHFLAGNCPVPYQKHFENIRKFSLRKCSPSFCEGRKNLSINRANRNAKRLIKSDRAVCINSARPFPRKIDRKRNRIFQPCSHGRKERLSIDGFPTHGDCVFLTTAVPKTSSTRRSPATNSLSLESCFHIALYSLTACRESSGQPLG